MQFETAAATSTDEIHEATMDAYSDYVIPLKMTAEQHHAMLADRGFAPELSWLAREGGEIKALWLTGVAPEARPGTSYTITVGTRPSARRRGLAQQLFEHVAPLLKAQGYRVNLLEAIVTNTGAVRLYEGLGYKSERILKCYKGAVPEHLRAAADIVVEEVSLEHAAAFAEGVEGWQPSWQNDFPVMQRAGERAQAFLMHMKGTPAGFAVTVPSHNQITQIGVLPGSRRQGVARTLMTHLRDTLGFDTGIILNIPDTDETTQGFFKALGWQNSLDQFEMVCPL